ncbi:hypothetical protein VOLCADRAFT_90146, partial [Volvox carteri f. nagariensis]
MASLERKDALLEVFRLIDVGNDGFLDFDEVKALASDSTTQGKIEEAVTTILMLDLNGDAKVSAEEFVEVFLFVTSGMDEQEFELFVDDMKVHAGGGTSREMMLKRVFSALDRDHSGVTSPTYVSPCTAGVCGRFIEMHELKTLVGCVGPEDALERARGTLRMFDTDADEKVSVEEFLTFFDSLVHDMSDTDFRAFVSHLTEKGFELLYEGNYRHPHGCRTWLEEEVMPTLKQGMLELLKEVEKDVMDLATGIPWEEGEHMPRGWRPFSPLHWLSNWLLNAATGGRPRTTEQGEDGDDGEGPGLVPVKNLEAMSREEKVVYLFNQIDVNGSGTIPTSHLVSMAELIFADGAGGIRDARNTVIAPVLAGMGLHPLDGVVDLQEFQTAMAQMTSMLSDSEFDEAARIVAAQRDWRYCRTRADKFRYLFHSLDLDHSGSLNFQELKLLAQRMDPDTSEETVSATLEYMDRDNSDSVSVEEFVEALGVLLGHVDSETELDDMPAPAATWGYALAGGPASAAARIRETLAAATAAAQPSAQPPVVAAYCSTGELGGVAALLLSEALRITVYNMCGGIINYYNQGGSVIRVADGKQVSEKKNILIIGAQLIDMNHPRHQGKRTHRQTGRR